MLDVTYWYVLPPSRETSIRAIQPLGVRLDDHVIGTVAPMNVVAPAAGPVTVADGSTSVKLELVVLVLSAPETLTVMRRRASTAPGPEIAPVKDLWFGIESTIV